MPQQPKSSLPPDQFPLPGTDLAACNARTDYIKQDNCIKITGCSARKYGKIQQNVPVFPKEFRFSLIVL
jgi:hypothetical protein